MIASATGIATRTAVVRAADGVRFTATASCNEPVTRQLIEYIASRCDDVLWPAVAREVRQLIATHRDSDAIAAYFSNVGFRWDEEWLEINIECSDARLDSPPRF